MKKQRNLLENLDRMKELSEEKTTQGNYADNILSQNQPIGEMKGVGENPQGTIGNTQNEA